MIYQADLDPEIIELPPHFRELAAGLRTMLVDLRAASNMLVRRDQAEDDELATLDHVRRILTDLADGHEELADGFEATARIYDDIVCSRIAATSPLPNDTSSPLTHLLGAGHLLLLLLGFVSAVTLGIAAIKELRPSPAGTPYTVTEIAHGDR
ncbi:hypothetical protein [Sphingomonas parapaucimobilis]|jgi:hypothetical protein|uniref:hypothetical protein n=1 Tax=Sphingomonas parapaucimobilis TaxID=28213 RepID=UPI0035C82F3A